VFYKKRHRIPETLDAGDFATPIEAMKQARKAIAAFGLEGEKGRLEILSGYEGWAHVNTVAKFEVGPHIIRIGMRVNDEMQYVEWRTR
jgi:hypothetical protein